MIEKTKNSYSSLRKAIRKETKTIRDQEKEKMLVRIKKKNTSGIN